ncbi:MAG: phosphoribosylformylglycinamidine synthase subunit PurQ [Pseudomonadota bacterium]
MAVRALVPTGYGLNCDYETDYSLKRAGADSHRFHINELIMGKGSGPESTLDYYHIMVLGGGFSWADDHGAGVILASKLKFNLGEQIERFVDQGKLVMGICNGFQGLVNLGLLPGFEGNYKERRVAVTYNDSGNFIDTWVNLKINPESPSIFTKGISHIELPVRHGEGKFYASEEDLDRIFMNNQVVMQYADGRGEDAKGRWPMNPNGSLGDIAGICDPTGRIFGLMPHPEAFNHYTNHPDWTRRKSPLEEQGIGSRDGDGISIFINAVEYIKTAIADGRLEE